jgi:preprotein translocase subunit YajC
MLISAAYAAGDAAAATPVGAGEAFMMNMGLILVLVVLFYVLLIIPQQRRFKEHRQMIDAMKKGDKVLTAGGLIGTVDSVNSEKGEVVVDLGNGVKVTALRATIQTRIEDKK